MCSRKRNNHIYIKQQGATNEILASFAVDFMALMEASE